MPNEQKAKVSIDRLLTAASLAVQAYKHYNPGAPHSIALRDVQLKDGRCDYPLIVDRAAVGIIEAKREGKTLSDVADQSAFYAGNLALFLTQEPACVFCTNRTEEVGRRFSW